MTVGLLSRQADADAAIRVRLRLLHRRKKDTHTHPLASILLASIGLQDTCLPSVLESPVILNDGDAILLGSDGIWRIVDDKVIEQYLSRLMSLLD